MLSHQRFQSCGHALSTLSGWHGRVAAISGGNAVLRTPSRTLVSLSAPLARRELELYGAARPRQEALAECRRWNSAAPGLAAVTPPPAPAQPTPVEAPPTSAAATQDPAIPTTTILPTKANGDANGDAAATASAKPVRRRSKALERLEKRLVGQQKRQFAKVKRIADRMVALSQELEKALEEQLAVGADVAAPVKKTKSKKAEATTEAAEEKTAAGKAAAAPVDTAKEVPATPAA